jgi:hypothetical protein
MGKIRLELLAPFAYLQDITKQVRHEEQVASKGKKAKTARIASGLGSGKCSDNFLWCGENRNLSEQSPSLNRSTFIQRIQFPYHAHLVRLSTLS